MQRVCQHEPSKPSKVIFEGIAGTTSKPSLIAKCLSGEWDASASQILQWVEARCARGPHVWGAEKFLWRDYEAWSHQSKQSACPPKLFRETLNQCFEREADGWRGVALAMDVAPKRFIM